MNIRLVSSCRRTELTVGDYNFSAELPADTSTPVLYEWGPQPVGEGAGGIRAWYCCEPTSSTLYSDPVWRAWRDHLTGPEFLYHAHPDERYRVPHITCEADPVTRHWSTATKAAIALVSNTGGSPLRRTWDARLRNRLITRPEVDLFGSRASWTGYRATVLSRPRPPLNYRGELEGYWTNPAKLDLFAQYRVAVCLENTTEPHYFTEKFVDAVRAGCVPVYHAHPTVRAGPLRGALWVDPADFGFDASSTLAFALSQDIDMYRRVNGAWLDSSPAQATFRDAVFTRIGDILRDRATTLHTRSSPLP